MRLSLNHNHLLLPLSVCQGICCRSQDQTPRRKTQQHDGPRQSIQGTDPARMQSLPSSQAQMHLGEGQENVSGANVLIPTVHTVRQTEDNISKCRLNLHCRPHPIIWMTSSVLGPTVLPGTSSRMAAPFPPLDSIWKPKQALRLLYLHLTLRLTATTTVFHRQLWPR